VNEYIALLDLRWPIQATPRRLRIGVVYPKDSRKLLLFRSHLHGTDVEGFGLDVCLSVSALGTKSDMQACVCNWKIMETSVICRAHTACSCTESWKRCRLTQTGACTWMPGSATASSASWPRRRSSGKSRFAADTTACSQFKVTMLSLQPIRGCPWRMVIQHVIGVSQKYGCVEETSLSWPLA
jgi:hypothetical protein